LIKVFESKLNTSPDALIGIFDGEDDEPTGGMDAFGAQQLSSSLAYLPIKGTIVPRTGGLKPHCGMTPTYGIMNKIRELENDPNIRTLILHIDTGGGMLTGVPELAKYIRASRLEIIGYTDTKALSAGYWILSACDQIVVTESAQLGSIGVYIPVTKNNNKESKYSTTYFSAGGNKLHGASDIPLTEKESSYFQASVDSSYVWFTKAVSEYRGVSIEEIIATEASVYTVRDGESCSILFDEKVNSIEELIQGVM
jgi:ClpP class serine protease